MQYGNNYCNTFQSQDKAKPIVREGRNTTGLDADSRVTLCEWGDSAFLLYRQIFRLNFRKLLEIDMLLKGG
jgi:hypothetical protein